MNSKRCYKCIHAHMCELYQGLLRNFNKWKLGVYLPDFYPHYLALLCKYYMNKEAEEKK